MLSALGMPSFSAVGRAAGSFLLGAACAGATPAWGWRVSTTHPRLLVRADSATVGVGPTVTELRLRRNHPDVQHYASLVASDASWEGVLTPALQTLLGGEATTLPQVRGWLLEQTSPPKRSVARQGPGHMAIAFDWIHDQLAPEDRAQVAENIRTGADAALAFLHLGRPDIVHNFTYMSLFSVAMAGLVLQDEPGYEAVASAYLEVTRDWLEGPGGVYDTFAALGGALPEGDQYAFTESIRLLVLTLHGLRSATDTDPFERIRTQHADFLRGTARFYMAMTRPDLTLERIGDMNQYKPLLRSQHRFVLEALASGLRTDGGDPREPAMLEHFSDLVHDAYGNRDTHRNFGWGMVVFDDPAAPRDPAAYEAQPLLQVFGRGVLDQVVIRDGWNEGGVMLTFLAGDHFVDHQHFDKGAFTIYHRGGLAIDSGAYDRMYGAHHSQYATRTIAHNAPLVFDPEQPVPADYKREGGQRVLRGFQHHARWTDFLAHRAAEHLDAAHLTRSEEGRATALTGSAAGAASGAEAPPATDAHAQSASNGEAQLFAGERQAVQGVSTQPAAEPAPYAHYVVAQAELAGAYGPVVRGLRRTLAYWPAARIVLVDDAFDLAKPLDVAFQLHTQSPLLAAGAAATKPGATELRNVDAWVTTRDDSLDLGARGVFYDGRLFLRTITPRQHVARRIGGKGYQWWVNGVDYKPASNGGAPRESGAWRLEVHPKSPATRQHFVHAFLVADPQVYKMPAGDALQLPDGWRGAHVASAPEVALLIGDDGARLPIRYDIATSLPCVHVVVGLVAGTPVEVRSADASRLLRASSEGVVAFDDDQIGVHSIVIDVPGPQ